MASDTSYISL